LYAGETIVVSIKRSSPVSLSVVDLKGAVVCSKRVSGPGSTAGMDKGVYLVKVLCGSESLVRRVLVK
jgi:hypothetical protein